MKSQRDAKTREGFVGDGASRQAKRSQRKNKARGVARSTGRGKRNRGSGGSPSTSPPSRNYTSTFDLTPKGIDLSADIPSPNLDLNPIESPSPSIPSFRETPVPPGTIPPGTISFRERIGFEPNSARFGSYETVETQLDDLVTLLRQDPSLNLFIVGNLGHTSVRGTQEIVYGNSEQALNQQIRTGATSFVARNLMNSRAKAVYDFLIGKGVSRNQLDYGPGRVERGERFRVVSFEIRRR